MEDLLNPIIQPYMNIYANNINSNNLSIFGNIDISGNLNIKNIQNSLVNTPNAGYQTIFGNSDSNNNLTSKNSSNNLISLSSAISNFIVSSNVNDGMKYTTIQSAIDDAMLTGNTENIIIRSGVYNENITLHPKINLLGINTTQNINNPSVTINGLMTINFIGESTISNISFTNDSNNCINISGACVISINNCNFNTTTSGDCIYVNDLTSFVKCNYCNFINCPTLNYYINVNASNNVICYFCTIGALATVPPIGNLIVNSGLLVLIYSIARTTIFINDPGFMISLYNFMPLDDQPAFTLSGAGSTLICTNATILSNPTSSTDFITGTGNLIKSLISLNGRTTAAAGIVVSSFTIF